MDVRAKGPGWLRLLAFTAVGAASGFALALFGVVACYAAASPGQPGDLGIAFGQCFLVFAPVVGGSLGLVLSLLWPRQPSRPPWDD